MKYNQNHKIAQVTSRKLIIGVDIARFAHVARARMPFHFGNAGSDFEGFLEWIHQLLKKHSMEKAIVGMEPTGHYWFNLAHFSWIKT